MTHRPLPALRFGLRRVSPSSRGFRMPAEWEPHRATWLIWPHNRADWGVKTRAVEWCYGEIIRHLIDRERVSILVQNETIARRARLVLDLIGVPKSRVDMYQIPTNRSWIRDSGPLFVLRTTEAGRRDVAITDWRFNGWAKYRAWQRDDALSARISDYLKMRRFAVEVRSTDQYEPIVLEGGSIDVNGRGLLLTTKECLLSPIQCRNPGLTRETIEQALKAALGVRRVIWLESGIAGDDTHGHVDDVARFVSSGTVVAAVESDPADLNYSPLRANLAILKQMRDLRGRPLRVVSIPMPRPVYFKGERLPASYLNFYISNGLVMVPTFNDPHDRLALNRLATLFPSREVVGIYAGDLILGLGALHCITQQEPH
jgi:agmatine deiminase